ncbi:MAG: class I SAM-dependent methyltransferase [Firmicutes bacterium]|nr:class I SAM-dependent methyltransferase [Bacillota bacterium]
MLEKTDKLLFFYENLVNWNARLAKEGDFIKKIFDACGAKNILDCGCGLGKHVFFLRENGYNAHGSDLNPKHYERAKIASESLNNGAGFFLEDMTELPQQGDGSWDGVMSLGNTLSSMGKENVRKAFSAFNRVLGNEGVLIGQILNFAGMVSGDRTEVRSAVVDGKEVIYVKTFHVEDEHYLVITNVLTRIVEESDGDTDPVKKWDCMVESTKMYGLSKEFVEESLKDAGFREVRFFGSLAGNDYETTISKDLVFVAYK